MQGGGDDRLQGSEPCGAAWHQARDERGYPDWDLGR